MQYTSWPPDASVYICHMLNLFGVVVFHRCMVNWMWGALVYVHSPICETYLVQWYSIDVWWIGGGVHLPQVYVHVSICETDAVQWYFIDLWSFWNMGALVCVHSAICETYLVQWYSIGSMVNWSQAWYMCILLYVKLIWCSGIQQIYGQLEGALEYVHSAIYETNAVQWYFIDLWSIGCGEPWYVCILLYVKLISCSGIP